MACRVDYKSSVKGDLKKLDKSATKKLLNKLEGVLSKNPHAGESLKGRFKGLFKYRIGDYRIVYAKGDDFVLVTRIRDRKRVYR